MFPCTHTYTHMHTMLFPTVVELQSEKTELKPCLCPQDVEKRGGNEKGQSERKKDTENI